MRRASRIDWGRWTARLRETPGLVLAGIFIGVSGMMSVSFGYRLGEPAGFALVFAAVAIAIEGFADLAMPLFWGRSGLWRRLLIVLFFGLCLAYKLEAAKRFAAENLGSREVAVATADQAYRAAQDKVEALRKTIAGNADARASGLIQVEIDALLRDPKTEGCTGAINGEVTKTICPKVDRLRAELVRAKARDDAQAELEPALAALRAASPAAGAGAASESTGPVIGLLALAGIHMASWSSFIANLVMMLIEGGAIILPMLIGAGGGDKRGTAPRGAGPEPAAGKPAVATAALGGEAAPPPAPPPGLTDRTRRDIADATAFRLERCEHADGERVQATALYVVYEQWKIARGETPMKMGQFGLVITRHLGVAKLKSDGKNWYVGLRLRHPGQGRQGVRHLQRIAA